MSDGNEKPGVGREDRGSARDNSGNVTGNKARSRATETGGRDATTRHIPPLLALAVGMPKTPAPENWNWTALTKLARMESGHKPSRRHPEYWDGTVPWIGIKDARGNHGRRIDDTLQKTNALGIANSSARLLPENTVCLSRTASVGYVVVMGRPMATSQDFVNWVCAEQLDPEFLKYLFIAEGDDILRFASGSVHQTIYFPEAKAFHICHPPLPEQRRIVGILDEAFAGIATAKANAEKNRHNARALFESHLNAVFTQRGKGWTQTTIEKQVDFLAGFAFKSSQYTDSDDGVRLVRGDNIAQGELRWDGVKRWPRTIAGDYAQFSMEENDVILAMDRPWVAAGLKVAVISKSDLPCLQVQRTARLRVKHSLHWRYLFHLIRSSRYIAYLLDGQTGLGVPHISGKQILSFEFLLPPLSEQRVIVKNLDALQAETQRLESIYQRKLAALDELKKSLLHQAFSGQL